MYAFSSVSRSVVSNSLQPRESQHARPPCPSPTSGVYSNSNVPFREEQKTLSIIQSGELTRTGSLFFWISHHGMNGTPSPRCLRWTSEARRPGLSQYLSDTRPSPAYLTHPVAYAESGALKGAQWHWRMAWGFDTEEIKVSKPGLCRVLKLFMEFLGKIVEGMTEVISGFSLHLSMVLF